MPYGSELSRSMADLMIASGQARADVERRKGEIWGSTMASLSQIPGQVMALRQGEQDRALALEDRAQTQKLRLTQQHLAELALQRERMDEIDTTLLAAETQEDWDQGFQRLKQLGIPTEGLNRAFSVGQRNSLRAQSRLWRQEQAALLKAAQAEPLVGVGPENILTPRRQAAGQPGYVAPPPPEPLVGVGPENVLTPRSQAAGQRGYVPPQAPEPLVPVVGPRGPVYAPRSEAAGQLVPQPREPQGPQPQYLWAKGPDGIVRRMTEQEARMPGVEQPDTASMRDKAKAKEVAALAVQAVRDLGARIITKVGPAQRADAIARGAEAVWGTDPEFRTYQDARMALAGTLAVEQQGARISDADVRALWLPMVPDAYRDTKESNDLKWRLIDAMRGVKGAAEPAAAAPAGANPFRARP